MSSNNGGSEKKFNSKLGFILACVGSAVGDFLSNLEAVVALHF